jgi:valyl-tRNA synthetase
MSRFVWSNLEGYAFRQEPDPAGLDLPSRWVLSRLTGLMRSVQRLFDVCQYGEAGRQVLDFLWSEFADWYVEVSKNALYSGDQDLRARALDVLGYVLNTCLRLLHPYMPFITEEIWSFLPFNSGPLLLAPWPTANDAYEDAEAEGAFGVLTDLIRGIRNARAEYQVEPGHRVRAIIDPGARKSLIEAHRDIFARLCNVHEIDLLGAAADAPEQAATVVSSDVTVYLPLADLVDVEAEVERLTRERDNLDKQIARTQGLLGNDNFVTKAKPEVVGREREKLTALTASRQAIEERLASLSS